VISDPVFTDDGHTYDRAAILAHFAQCVEAKLPFTSDSRI
jgi:hypothetical protein